MAPFSTGCYTIVLAIILLGETLELFHIGGIALIAAGIVMSSRKGARL